MLIRLLRAYLRPYRRPIAAVVVLQLIQTLATLYLPTLNAEIIDNGVITGDTRYIMRTGGVMLAVTVVQVICSIGAVYFGARTAMALGRDLRHGVFERVQRFSAREVGRFGTPSLITRTTNDVQQVQMLALMTFTMMVSAPIMCVGGIILALNQDVPLSSLLLVAVPALGIIVGFLISRMRPLFRLMQVRIDRINQVLREQISGVRVIRAFVKDGQERDRFAVANTELFGVSLGVGRLLASRIGKRAQPQFVRQWSVTGQLNGHIEEMFTGHALVTAFGQQHESLRTFTERNEALFQASYRAQFISGCIQSRSRGRSSPGPRS